MTRATLTALLLAWTVCVAPAGTAATAGDLAKRASHVADPNQRLELLDEALAINPHHVPALVDRARVHLALDDPDRVERMRGLAWLTVVLGLLDPQEAEQGELVDQIQSVLESRFPRLNPVEQAMVIRMMSPQPAAQQRFSRIQELAVRLEQPLPRITYLATQVEDLEAPALAAAVRSEDPQIAAFAEALRGALELAANTQQEAP